MKDSTQNLIYFFILALIALIVFAFIGKTKTEPHGIFLPQTKQTYPAIQPDKVKVLTSLPAGEQPIGIVNASSHFDSLNAEEIKQAEKANLRFAKKLAAEKGGNAIYYRQGHTPKAGATDGVVLQSAVYRL